jgi:hypothetical protein
VITFTLDGQSYEFDDNKLALKEALAIKEHTGLGVRMFQLGLNMSEPAALQAMVWLSKTRAGTKIRFEDVDFDCYDLLSNLRNTAVTRDAADPTAGQEMKTGSSNGTTPGSDETPTSEPSPTTSE